MNNVTTLPHPKAAASKARSAERQVQREGIKRAVATHGLHFHSVANYTFCYRVDKRNVIEVSSAIRHPNDPQDPHMGRVVAIERFAAGNRMHLRVPPNFRSVRGFLNFTFDN